MSFPTLDALSHGDEDWDATLNDDLATIAANFARRTNGSDHGAETDFIKFEQELTLSGASVTTTGLIPAGYTLIGVTSRVTVTITGATTWDLGDGTTQDLYANDKALTAG